MEATKDTNDLVAVRPGGDGVYHRKAKLALREVLAVALAVTVLHSVQRIDELGQ